MGHSDKYVANVLRTSFEPDPTLQGVEAGPIAKHLTGLFTLVQSDEVPLITITGGAGSGKSTLTKKLIGSFEESGLTAGSISSDDFVVRDRAYRRKHLEHVSPLERYDFLFMESLIEQIRQSKIDGESVRVPKYDDTTGTAIDSNSPDGYGKAVGPVDVLIVEGDINRIYPNTGLRIYLHLDDAKRLASRVDRDLLLRGAADKDEIVANFTHRHTNQHTPHTIPAVDFADIVIHADNTGGAWTYDLHNAA